MDIPIRHFSSLDSTMEKARELLRGNPGDIFIVMTDEQRVGRGRVEGRRWEGAPGASLLMTLCMKGEFSSIAALPLRIGLAVHEALGKAAPGRLRVKWPNDIMGICAQSEDSYLKLGGLLCETTGKWLLVGIGLNLKPEAYPSAMGSRATSLTEVAEAATNRVHDGSPDARVLASTIGNAVLTWLEREDWREEYEKVMWAFGKEVGFIVGHPDQGLRRSGTIRGIDEAGRIILSNEEGEVEAFWSGEIFGLGAAAPAIAPLQRP